MQSLRLGHVVAVCSILLGTCLLTAKTSPVPAASFGEAEKVVGDTSSTEKQDREDFGRLVQYVKSNEQVVTVMEKRAKCPYKTLSFDGVTHVVCDYPQCHDFAQCQQRCRQAIAYLKPDTRNITKEKPGSEHEKVYIGCIYEGKTGKQSTEPPAVE
jgi:NAD-dependent dihydropyrimidine dehydrogenase PreA subunit